MIELDSVKESFSLYLQGYAHPAGLRRLGLRVAAGERGVVAGSSGMRKSTLLKPVCGTAHGGRMIELDSATAMASLGAGGEAVGSAA